MPNFREDSAENRALQLQYAYGVDKPNLGRTPRSLSERVTRVQTTASTDEYDPKPQESLLEKPEKNKLQYPFSQGKFSELRYPNSEILKDQDYLKIDVLEYKPSGLPTQRDVLKKGLPRANDKYGIKDSLGSILLPIPQNITDTNSTGWGDDSISAAGAYAIGIYDTVAKDDNFFEGLFNAFKQAGSDLSDIAVSGDVKNAANAFFGSQAANLVPGTRTSFGGVLARSFGQIINPNTELLFNGIKLRSFNFTFNLAPRDKPEADKIKNIVRILKTNMAANRRGELSGIFLKSPNVFQLNYMKGGIPHPHLNKFFVAALTNMQVNYTGSGVYATYQDGMPVHMTMTLSFQELSPIYADDQSSAGGMGY